jgi:hypothetical protein
MVLRYGNRAKSIFTVRVAPPIAIETVLVTDWLSININFFIYNLYLFPG